LLNESFQRRVFAAAFSRLLVGSTASNPQEFGGD